MEGRNQLKEGLRRTKKVVPHSLGLMDFAIRLVKSILNLPNKQEFSEVFGELHDHFTEEL